MPEIMRARREIGAFYYRFPDGESGADVASTHATCDCLRDLWADFDRLLVIAVRSRRQLCRAPA